MAQTVIEKIVQAHAVGLKPGREVRAGDYVTIVPDHVMTHDNTSAVLGKFKGLGAGSIKDPAAAGVHPGPQHPGPERRQPGQVPRHRRCSPPSTASTPTRPAAASATRS